MKTSHLKLRGYKLEELKRIFSLSDLQIKKMMTHLKPKLGKLNHKILSICQVSIVKNYLKRLNP